VVKIARRAVVFLIIALGVLFLLPAEKAPLAGGWLVRNGLESRTVRLPRGPLGASLDVRYVRAGQGPTVILIHGLASSIYTWAEVIGPLSKSFDVIALDLPGFGASSQPGDLSFNDLPRAVIGLMDALQIKKAHFVGNSMGGAVSLLMAARQRERVDHVAILDSAGFRMRLAERPFMIRVLGSEAAGFFADRLPIRRALTSVTLRHLMQDDARVSPERIDEYLAPLLRPGALAAARSLLRSPLDEAFVSDLGLIEAKTLVVWGRLDPWLPETDADLFVAKIRTARKVVLETGHMPQEEKPAEVARLVGEFLIS
jgi:pimeloyl-ACP methyl ester carboxylesterase